MVKVYQRQSGQVIEPVVYQEGLVNRLYHTRWGRWLLPLLTRPSISYLLTLSDYLPWSKAKVRKFLETYDLSLADYQEGTYPHFAAFFQRKIQPDLRPVCPEGQVLAVADAKLQVFYIHEDLSLVLKGQSYDLAELLEDDQLAQAFQGGLALVFRLGVEDLHRYLAIESGVITHQKSIKGRLHSVREVAQAQRLIYRENSRHYCLIETEEGPVLQMEIGALLVGRIYNHHQSYLVRGQEKGYFGLGGSTIVVLYPANRIELDQDIRYYSDLGIESQVRMGERIGVKHV